MNEQKKQLTGIFSQGIKRTQFLAQAGAPLKYDELVEVLENALQAFALKEYSLLKSVLRVDRFTEESVYTNKKLFLYLSRTIINLASKRNFDQVQNRYYSLADRDRVILSGHYILKMDFDLLSEILEIDHDSILESLARSEAKLINDEKLFEDLPLLINECSKATKTIAFARGVLSKEKKQDFEHHISNCDLCGKLFDHVKRQVDQVVKFVPSIELEQKDVDTIVDKAVDVFIANDTRSDSFIAKGAQKLKSFLRA